MEIKNKVLKMLDFNVIIELLKGLAVTDEVKMKIDTMTFYEDYYLVKRHLGETTEARILLDEAGSIPLHRLSGIAPLLDKLKRHESLRPSEFEQLAGFIKESNRLKRFMHAKKDSAIKIADYALSITDLEHLSDRIYSVIVGGRVDDQASPTLSKIRRKTTLLEDRIKGKLHEMLMNGKLIGALSEAVISQRGGRYVLPVKAEQKRTVDGHVLDKSRSGGTVFIEPAVVKKLTDELEQLRVDEEHEVIRILWELTNAAAAEEASLRLNHEVMVTYDFLFSKAKLSRKMQGQEVALTDSRCVHIINGRHPLVSGEVVPLNIHVGETTNKSGFKNLVITGPNTGGKTVAMKTVGLFCLMTQAGLHVPADSGTSLCLFSRVLSDIGDGQSVEQNLSTFSSHVTNIIEIVEEANDKSLIILDEIGAGTDPSEGMGIGIAVLEALNAKGSMILASTHYNEIKVFAQNHPNFINGSMAFDLKTLSPLYRLEVGKAGASNALHIARRIGMSEAIIKRAHELAYHEDIDFDDSFMAALNEGAQDSTIDYQSEEQSTIKQVSSMYAPKKESLYKIGDVVYVKTMKRQGTICELENTKGEVGVMVMGKRYKISHKRIAPYIDSKDLYPDDYDLKIVFETKEDRKKDKLMQKGKGHGIFIEKKGNV